MEVSFSVFMYQKHRGTVVFNTYLCKSVLLLYWQGYEGSDPPASVSADHPRSPPAGRAASTARERLSSQGSIIRPTFYSIAGEA